MILMSSTVRTYICMNLLQSDSVPRTIFKYKGYGTLGTYGYTMFYSTEFMFC